MEVNGKNNSFITLKDHKENFNNNPTVRLINPAKNELGHISKAILDTTNKNIREAMGLNQWRNTDTVIDWFKSIRNTHLCKFVVFDIREFYPSIMRVSSKSFHETLHRKVQFPGIWLGCPSRSSPNYWTRRYHGIVILTFYSFG